MNLSDFDYKLPEERIAAYPLKNRTQSRLLGLPAAGELWHRSFSDLPSLLKPNDLLVINDTQVMKARLFGQKQTGGKIECLIERIVSPTVAYGIFKSSKPLKVGATVELAGMKVTLAAKQGDEYECVLGDCIDKHVEPNQDSLVDWESLLATKGELPLPPYLSRRAEESDESRYQTVYAREMGAVAAPTAGLHFDNELLDKVKRCCTVATVTLHVGLGTFMPVRAERISEHRMHSEYCCINESLAEKLIETKKNGGRVIAVGTTSMRALESAAAYHKNSFGAYSGQTDIFIYPGVPVRVVDVLITNFHLPRSTLLMLVSALAGKDRIQKAYQTAIEREYRFFSYGDAMWIEKYV